MIKRKRALVGFRGFCFGEGCKLLLIYDVTFCVFLMILGTDARRSHG